MVPLHRNPHVISELTWILEDVRKGLTRIEEFDCTNSAKLAQQRQQSITKPLNNIRNQAETIMENQ